MSKDPEKILTELYQMSDFLQKHEFELSRSDDDDSLMLGSGVRNAKGYELIVTFSIKDEEPDVLVSAVYILSRCSLEQVRIISEKLAQQDKRLIDVYEGKGVKSLVSYFNLDELEECLIHFYHILEQLDKNLMFVI